MNEHDVQTSRATLEQSATGLPPEEQAQPRLVTQGTGVGPATAGQTDVAGHMAPLYDDGFGNKGRPRPVEGTGGGLDPLDLIPDPYRRIPGLFADGIRSFPP